MESEISLDASPALMRLRNKPEAPQIDFTVFTQEDGTVVSTRDRVIKGFLRFILVYI
jgi:hypothetical protein